MAEAAIASIAEQIIANLLPQALQKVGRWCGVKREFEALKDTVSTLQAVLDDAEEQYYQSRQIQVWLQRLKDIFYDAQDVLEEFNIKAFQRELKRHNEIIKGVRTFFSTSNQLAFQLKMSYKVRSVRERMEAIKADRGFHLNERPVDLRVEGQWRKREETHSFIREGDIKGRDDDKKMVIKFLLDSNMKEHVSILSIVGMGGLGKTALAQCVYNDEMVSRHFDLKMWVCVSNDFEVKKIVKNIIACAKEKEPTGVAMEQLQSELRAEIERKKYLLILDDLWDVERETWLKLKTLLLEGARGSKILITTRLTSVAEITSTAPPHLLRGLSESASLDLLLQMACREEEGIQDPDMLAIGKEIVKKCSGVPLVLRTVGSLLFFKKTKLEWSHFKEYELPELSQKEDRIISVLRLSYDRLPSHLKHCFAFCSLFPKDCKIEKQTLVNLWMAEGFIEPSNRSQHLEDIAHEYFMDLLWSNFFQDFQEDTETCKMHDLMHDLACLVAGTECWVAWDNKKSIFVRTRHVSHHLTSNVVGELPISRLKASALRTFLSARRTSVFGDDGREPKSEAYLCQLIQSFKSLRILDLHAIKLIKVPESICKLKYLTYLDLSYNIALKRLPNSITRLQNLQTLNLYNCLVLEELPRGMSELVSLQNLDIDYCCNLRYVPRGLGQLSSLHRLTRFILDDNYIFPEDEALAKNYCGLWELNGLNNIRGSLSIENLGGVTDAIAESKAANLLGKHSLKSLHLHWGLQFKEEKLIGKLILPDELTIWDRHQATLDGLRPHSNLQELMIRGYRSESFPRWMMDSLVFSLPNLVEIRLIVCERCTHLPPLGQLPHLKFLEIHGLAELEYIESDHSSTLTGSFPSLLRLWIGYCKNLKAMVRTPHLEELRLFNVNTELINQMVGLNKLKGLSIWDMSLRCLPEEIEALQSLQRFEIIECPMLKSLPKRMRRLASLTHLDIFACPDLEERCKKDVGADWYKIAHIPFIKFA